MAYLSKIQIFLLLATLSFNIHLESLSHHPSEPEDASVLELVEVVNKELGVKFKIPKGYSDYGREMDENAYSYGAQDDDIVIGLQIKTDEVGWDQYSIEGYLADLWTKNFMQGEPDVFFTKEINGKSYPVGKYQIDESELYLIVAFEEFTFHWTLKANEGEVYEDRDWMLDIEKL